MVVDLLAPRPKVVLLVRDGLPVGVGPLYEFLGLFPPYLQPMAVVRRIELAIDDGPSLGIDRILLRRCVVGRAHRAVAVVLRRVAVRIRDKQIAVIAAGKAPAQLVP